MKGNRPRPVFPKRALITAGMPYGNKSLHFGHVGGVFIQADVFARFLKDRIGKDNVIFVSGTDCYGSPIVASYNALLEKGYKMDIESFVRNNHEAQKKSLLAYYVEPSLYATSALDRPGKIHKEVSDFVFGRLYDRGFLSKESSPQFYDTTLDTFLNGRQVEGICPIEGCESERAYADECSLGHQYSQDELIEPKSALTGSVPELRPVENWYFRLEEFMPLLNSMMDKAKGDKVTRLNLIKSIEEFLKPPIIYIKKKLVDSIEDLVKIMPEAVLSDEKSKASYGLTFKSLADRDIARDILKERGIAYRTGKTLVPFRLTGNISWGVPVEEKDGLSGLTFWVWPESLWAPISFTQAYLESIGENRESYLDWWFNEEAKVYQFIGEDNIYFYAIAEMGMFDVVYGDDSKETVLPHIVSNNHVLFGDKKASSSSEIKPPMADELLNHYTPAQLRMHFLSLALSKKSASFNPKPFMNDSSDEPDVVLKDGNLLTNVFNRLVRSCFYTAQRYFDGMIPKGAIDQEIIEMSKDAIHNYEFNMHKQEFHSVIITLDSFIRKVNKYYVANIKEADAQDSNELRASVLATSFYALRVITTLIHPIDPVGSEKVREYLGVDERIWSWEYIFEGMDCFADLSKHKLKHLEPRVDFFEKHPSQLEE